MQVTPQVKLIRYTADPEATVALAAKLCYSDRELPDLTDNIMESDNSTFISRLTEMGHLSPIEHASFTFSIEGVSRALLAQITRHRIASFSVRSQRYVSEDSFNYVIPPAIEELGRGGGRAIRRANGYHNGLVPRLAERARQGREFQRGRAVHTAQRVRNQNDSHNERARAYALFPSCVVAIAPQWEIRSVAWKMLEEVVKIAPNLFRDCGPACLNGACPGRTKSRAARRAK